MRDLPDAPVPPSVWERRHPDHAETWAFDFTVPDASLAGFVALTFLPRLRVAWYWAGLVGAGRPYLLVRDQELTLPRRPAAREVRGEALWAAINCETPHEHWSLGLEAFGVSLADPDEALGAERGDRTGLGLDLEWEATGPVVGGEGDYEQPCQVHGEVLVGTGRAPETLPVVGSGWRRHAWGAVDWLAPRWSLRGQWEDGTGYGCGTGGGAQVEVLRRAPLRLVDGDRGAVLERSLARFRPGRADEGDGARGLGWVEEVRSAPDLLLGEPNMMM